MSGELPGVLELGWWLFMKPVRLHRRLKNLGVEPNARPWTLWRAGGVSRAYLGRMVLLLVLGNLSAFLLAGVLWALGVPMDWGKVAGGVTYGTSFGVTLGLPGGLARGVASSIAISVAAGVAFGATGGVAAGVGVGVAVGVAASGGAGVAGGVPGGVAADESRGLEGVVARSVFEGMLFGVLISMPFGMVIGVSVGMTFIPLYFRLPFLLLELPAQFLAYALARSGRPTLHLAPVLHHDLSYLPHPFLADHILLCADAQPALTREVLDACAIAPGQRKTGRRALLRLQARSLERLAQAGDWGAIAELSGPWLPGVEAASPLLLALREVGRYAQAAQVHLDPRQRLQQLQRARDRLVSAENALLAAASEEARLLDPVIPALRAQLDHQAAALAAAAATVLPNPFRAGRPLTPEEGAETFRGREALVRRLGALLGDPRRRGALVLLGPRRCGKTSLLRMLPALLPDALVVFVDLQDNPTSSPRAFFEAIARQAREAARRDRRFAVPELPAGPAFEAASAWLDALERAAAGHHVLLCVDEFERLETLFPGDRAELLRLMGLLRGITQHRRAVHLLVSGVAPFDELDLMWSDHLIGAIELRVEHLDQPTTLGLLTRPSDDFPPGTIPEAVALEVWRRTDGQPYLTQLYGQLLVLRLDATGRRAAEPADVDAIQDEVFASGSAFFRFTFGDCGPERQALLRRLAEGEALPVPRPDQRWLQRRGVLTPEGRIRVPALARWITEIGE